MRALFVSTPQPAHLDWGGYLATAQRLVEWGHTVLWASGEAVAPQVTTAGVPFVAVSETGWRDSRTFPPIDPATDPAALHLERQRRSFDTWLDVERVALAADSIERIARDFAPHCIVTEMFCLAPAFVAERLNVPLVVAGWPAIDNPPSQAPLAAELMARMQTLAERLNCQGRNLSNTFPAMQSPDLHLTWWSTRWYAGVSVLPQTVHAGGIAPSPLPPPHTLPSPNDRPWIFITLGTTFNRDKAFFRMAAQAVVNMGGLPVVAHGTLSDTEYDSLAATLPEHVQLMPRIEFAAVLPYTAAAIHHGGAGTTHALVIHGVPQIVVPHAGDQGFQARAVARVGVGAHLPARQMSIDSTQRLLAALLPDRSPFRAHAASLKSEFAALGGIDTSASRIANVARTA